MRLNWGSFKVFARPAGKYIKGEINSIARALRLGAVTSLVAVWDNGILK
jgi:hypothetical protein